MKNFNFPEKFLNKNLMRGIRHTEHKNSRDDVPRQLDRSELDRLHKATDLEAKIKRIESIIQGKASKHDLEKLESDFSDFVASDNQGNVSSFSDSFYCGTGPIAIPPTDPFPFSNTCCSHNVISEQTYQIVEKSGTYSISYSITFQGSLHAKVGIAVNDGILRDSVRKIVNCPGTITGMILQHLNCGDKISLVNVSECESITLDNNGGFPLSLVIFQIGHNKSAERTNC